MKTFDQYIQELAGADAVVGCRDNPNFQVWGARSDLGCKKKKNKMLKMKFNDWVILKEDSKNKTNNTNLKDAIVDIAKSLETVFKKYSRQTRTKAWEKITSKDGEKEVKKILNDPNRPINTFQKLATQGDK